MQKIHNFIAHLQDQPLQVRKTIHMAVTVSVMVLIIGIWLATISAGGHQVVVDEEPAERPFSLIGEVIKDSYATAINGFKRTE